MPGRYSKQNELQQLQYEITNEISRDAKPIADGVFGNNARHPDMASISNQEIDQVYRDAYLRNDRTFLMQEAQRDPQQFLAITDRLGVPDPPIGLDGKPIGVDPNALQKTLASPPTPASAALPPSLPAPAPMAAPMPAAPGPVTSANVVSAAAAPPPPVQPPLPGMT